LNGDTHQIARPGEIDAAVTRLQWRDLQRRFVEATRTRTTRQQESGKQQGQRPDFRSHISRPQQLNAPISKSTANNERPAIALLFPRPKGSIGIPALVAQWFSQGVSLLKSGLICGNEKRVGRARGSAARR
jgi:hypothetical protein